MADNIVSVRAEKLQVTKKSHGHDRLNSHSDSDDGPNGASLAKGEIHSDSDDADDDNDGFQLPGDFGSTLFQTSRDSLEDEINQVFDAFCKDVKEACEAEAKTGAVKVECACDLRQDVSVQAVFLEELQVVFGKAGVYVSRGLEHMRAMDEEPAGTAFLFVWGEIGRDGMLREMGPMGHTVAIKAARGDPYDHRPETFYIGGKVDETRILRADEGVVYPRNSGLLHDM